MKKFDLLLFFTIILLCLSCSQDDEPIIDETATENFVFTDAQKYYLEVGLGTEFGNSTDRLKKWGNDLRIFVNHENQNELVEELDLIIEEINDISGSTKLYIVSSIEMSNFVVFLSDAATYASFEPAAETFIEDNWGVFWLKWNSGCMIRSGSMYVDINRTGDIDCQKHLLREELTQSLGLMTDSDSYDDSIFYQPWSCGTTYSEIDKEILNIHLDSRVKAGMTSDDIFNLFKEF